MPKLCLSINRFTSIGFFLLLTVGAMFAQPVQISITGADLVGGQPGVANFFPVQHVPGGAALTPAHSAPLNELPLFIPATTVGFYPDDVTNPANNPTLQNIVNHNIFVNPYALGANQYGQTPAGPTIADVDLFETRLFASNFMPVLNYYTGGAPARTVGTQGVITFNTYQQVWSDPELGMLLHAAGRTFGTGAGVVHHLFFRQGQDVCSTFSGGLANTACYSPDNNSTFAFCGFHDYIDFPDIGRVVFTVEPYTNVAGCRVPSGGPNTQAVDSMANVLSHEIFEVVSDPFLNAWWNRSTGEEIADICAFTVFDIPLSGHQYRIQGEYYVPLHACIWNY